MEIYMEIPVTAQSTMGQCKLPTKLPIVQTKAQFNHMELET